MKKKYLGLYFLFLFFSFSCQKKTSTELGSISEIYDVKFVFLDSLGRDYFIANNLKPFVFVDDPRSEAIYRDNNGNYEFIVRFYSPYGIPIYRNDFLLHIGNQEIDTVTIYGYSYYKEFEPMQVQTPEWLQEYSGSSRTVYLGIYELYYNGKLLSPPQVDKNGNWFIHKIVIK